MEQPLLSIIYVNYKSTDLLLESLVSLKKNTNGLDFEVIIVDNSKSRELKSRLAEFKSVRYFVADNKGFGQANNLGAKEAKGQFLLFMNPDTLISDGSVLKMVEYLKNHSEVGALSPLVYNPDGKLQKHFCANNISLWSITFGRWSERNNKKIVQIVSPDNSVFPVGMVSGAALMIKKELFLKIGGFDKNFFMYLEDDDLCLRLRKSGYQNAVLTTAKIIHLEGRSSVTRDKNNWYYQSQNYYFRKHYGLFVTLIMKLFRFPYRLIKK